jgi:PAS domain S-box-containing protein
MKAIDKPNEQMISRETEQHPIRIRTYTLVLGAIWSLIVLASLMWNIHQTKQGILDMARSQARAAYEKDVIYRRWNAGFGGVYVPVSEKSLPNQYLEASERDIVTPSGVSLTLMNPAYMTRQVHELAAEAYGVQGHITSLNPIRPANVADPWETKALEAFEHGAKEVDSVEKVNGKPCLRLMRPLVTEKGCLQCHAAQGYELGDIRGGISVSLPLEPSFAVERSQIVTLSLGHGFLWLLGLTGLWLGRRRLEHHISLRREVEDALVRSEEKFRTIIESSPMGIHMYRQDPDGRLLFTGANPSADIILGIDHKQFIGKTIEQAFPQLAGTEVPDQYRAVCTQGINWHTEQIDYEDERVKGAFEVYAFQTAPGMMATLFLEITERKRAEEANRFNESRLEALLQLNQMTGATLNEIAEFAMEEGVRLTQSSIGYVAFLNEDETVLTMHAWSRAAMQECRIDDKPIDYPVETTGLWGEAVRQRRPIVTNDYQAPNPLKRGTPRGHVTVLRHMNVPIFDGDRIVIVVGVGNKATDYDESDVRQLTLLMTGMWRIVQRKQAEEALRESRERFQELAELLPETIFEMDTGGNLTFVNRNAFEHFGYSQEDFEQGVNGFEMVCPEDRPRALENAKRVMSGEKIGLSEYKVSRKDGSTFPAIMHSSAKFVDGKPVGLRGIVIDITETKKLESQLRQAHKMEAIGTLAGGIAHDFNNLLQAVQGYAELLLLRKTEEEAGYKELWEISRAAKRGGELTRQLLTFSRKVESKLEPVDLNRTIDDVRMLLERTIPKMIRIELHLTGNLCHINADASQIEQVLMNLALNARDAMPDGGTLSIETKNIVLDEDSLRTQPELIPGKYVLLAVADTGHGMDKTTLEHVFDPFFTTKEVGKGTGLGLAMVYGIVKSHQGQITCISKPGEGTAFKICFPAIEQLEESPGVLTGAKELRGGNETVLLVDDDAPVRDLGERILKMFGYSVIAAPDGESAMEIYREGKNRIDLVILDLIMPGMGGAQCLQKILEMNPRAKVVIASGYSVDGETERAAKSGAKAFINKPYNVQQMLKVIREVLG